MSRAAETGGFRVPAFRDRVQHEHITSSSSSETPFCSFLLSVSLTSMMMKMRFFLLLHQEVQKGSLHSVNLKLVTCIVQALLLQSSCSAMQVCHWVQKCKLSARALSMFGSIVK